MKQLFALCLALICLTASAQEQDSTWHRYYSDGRAVIKRDSLYGFIDRQGNEVIPCQYKKAYNFNDGMSMVRHNYEVYAIDTMGRRLDAKVRIPQFKNRDFESFVYWVQRRLPFTSTEEYNRMKGEMVNAVITIGRDGTITACEALQIPSEEAFAKVRDVVMTSPQWTPGEVDGKAVEIRYLLPVKLGGSNPGTKCWAVDDAGQRIESNFTYPLFEGKYAYGFLDWFFSRRNMWFKNRDDYYKAGSGLVQAQFTVDKKGNIRDIEIVESHNDICRAKAIEVLNKSPRWTPGMIDGKPVAVRYSMPFYFNFR